MFSFLKIQTLTSNNVLDFKAHSLVHGLNDRYKRMKYKYSRPNNHLRYFFFKHIIINVGQKRIRNNIFKEKQNNRVNRCATCSYIFA